MSADYTLEEIDGLCQMNVVWREVYQPSNKSKKKLLKMLVEAGKRLLLSAVK